MDKELIKKIKSWIKDFESTQPHNLQIDDDTFEGSAYNIFLKILSAPRQRFGDGDFPITSVCREDLESEGFDISEVEDDTMEVIAEKMADAYCNDEFWMELNVIAENLKIPKKI